MILLLSLSSWAQTLTCTQEYDLLKNKLEAKYSLSEMRKVTVRVNKALSSQQFQELMTLSKKFNSIAHDTPEHIQDRFAMHARAREIVRTVTAKAGYRVLNKLPDSYDAVIGYRYTSDWVFDYVLDVRNLLVMADPRPHLTLRMSRMDSKHNEWLISSISLTPNPQDEYMSWYPNINSNRVVGSINQFLKSKLSAHCQ